MKLFLDCGTHLFQGLTYFNERLKFDDEWEVFSFEANPITYSQSIDKRPTNLKNFVHLNTAVSTYNGKINVNINKTDEIDQGTNILNNPPKAAGKAKFEWYKKIEIDCIDLVSFINERKFDYCVVKLDIEGTEFEILEKMIETNVIKRIDELYVEFHERFFTNELALYKAKRVSLINECRKHIKKFEVWV